jgi:hypothetical protein
LINLIIDDLLSILWAFHFHRIYLCLRMMGEPTTLVVPSYLKYNWRPLMDLSSVFISCRDWPSSTSTLGLEDQVSRCPKVGIKFQVPEGVLLNLVALRTEWLSSSIVELKYSALVHRILSTNNKCGSGFNCHLHCWVIVSLNWSSCWICRPSILQECSFIRD